MKVGKGVGMVGEVESDMDLGMTVIGEVVVVEWPEYWVKSALGSSRE